MSETIGQPEEGRSILDLPELEQQRQIALALGASGVYRVVGDPTIANFLLGQRGIVVDRDNPILVLEPTQEQE